MYAEKNRSGSVSIVVVDKSNGIFVEVKRFGVARTLEEEQSLYREATDWICHYGGQMTFPFEGVSSKDMAATIKNYRTPIVLNIKQLRNTPK